MTGSALYITKLEIGEQVLKMSFPKESVFPSVSGLPTSTKSEHMVIYLFIILKKFNS